MPLDPRGVPDRLRQFMSADINTHPYGRLLLGYPKVSDNLTSKSTCCKSRPRCKRCPVVYKRLEKAGHLTRVSKRKWTVEVPVSKKMLKAARAGAL